MVDGRVRGIAVVVLLGAVHCSSPPRGHDEAGVDASSQIFSFDAASLLVLPAQFTGEGMPLRMLSDGDPVDLVQPPQGGHVIFIGPKVQNLPPELDTIDLTVRFRREDSGAIVQEERRTVVVEPIAEEPGLVRPKDSRSQFGQPALCPDYEHEDILGAELVLEVEVSPLYVLPPVTALGVRRVVPTCDRALDQALCKCECTANYVLGRCPVTRGITDAGDED